MWPWLLPHAAWDRLVGDPHSANCQPTQRPPGEPHSSSPIQHGQPIGPTPTQPSQPGTTAPPGPKRAPDRASAHKEITYQSGFVCRGEEKSFILLCSCNSGERLSRWADHMCLRWGWEWSRAVSGGAQASVQTKPERLSLAKSGRANAH